MKVRKVANVSCSELEVAIAYMVLYEIYNEFQDFEKVDHCVTSILAIELEHFNGTCYTIIYEIIIAQNIVIEV